MAKLLDAKTVVLGDLSQQRLALIAVCSLHVQWLSNTSIILYKHHKHSKHHKHEYNFQYI